VTTQPGSETFAAELETANWRDTWLSLLAAGIIYAAILFFTLRITLANVQAQLANANLPPDQQQAFANAIQFAPYLSVLAVVLVPLGFIISMGVLFLFARLFGGTGTFLQQSYAFALFSVPVDIVTAVVSPVPCLGILVEVGLWVYSIVLGVMAMMASQRLTGGRATAAVLLPPVILIVLGCVGVTLAIALLFRASGGVTLL
jgi:hypothetical protein